ncbi:polysaccharide biosynthesis C-terminal domain-containing protein [Streptosporangium sp. NPDC051022]|uniref:lipopolysaccharide biosynthesis protein n=1 Tax=Streptosporangium sp. NPDC051022 TaxID=3155752 RepID=UPI00344254AC
MPRAPAMNLTAARVLQATVGNGLRLGLAAVTTVLIARTLQPEGRGLYAMIVATATISIVAGHLSVTKSQIALWQDTSRHRALTGNGLILGLLTGGVSALLTFVGTTLFAPGTAPGALGTALLAVPFGVAAINLTGILSLQSRTGLASQGVVLSALVLSLPVLTMAVTGHLTVSSAVVCWAASTTAPLVLFAWSLGPAALRGDVALARGQLSLSGRYHIGLVAQHLLLTADTFLLKIFVSTAEVGLYAAAGAFMALAWVPTDAIAQVVMGRQAAGDEEAAQEATARAIRFSLLLSSAVTAALAVASPVLIPLLYGTAYTGSIRPLLLLAPGAVALALIRPAEQYLVRLGRPMSMTALPAGALLLNLALNAVLIPRWGASGAATSSSLSYAALAAAEVLWFARTAGIGTRALLPRAEDLRSLFSLLSLLPGAGRVLRPAGRAGDGGAVTGRARTGEVSSGARGRGEHVLVAADAAPAGLQEAQREAAFPEE